MSAPTITSSVSAQAGPAAAFERVAQLEQMLAQVANPAGVTQANGGVAAPASGGAATSSTSADQFATMLAQAGGGSSGTSGASSLSAAGTAAGPSSYTPIIDAAAQRYGLNPAILEGLVHQESGFDPNAVSSAGAEGLTQVMPENFAADGITNPFDPTQSIDGGALQLSRDLASFNGNYTDALAAYNAGSAAVTRYGGVPPYAQTQNYVKDVLAYAAQLESADGGSTATASTNDPTTLGGIT